MTNREFVALVKKHAADEVVEAMIRGLKFPAATKPVDPNENPENQSFKRWSTNKRTQRFVNPNGFSGFPKKTKRQPELYFKSAPGMQSSQCSR